MTKREKIIFVINKLQEKYKEVKIALNYETEYQLMIAVILSAQCTDARVNIVTKELFKVVKEAKDIQNMNIEVLKKYIKSVGFFNAKANNIKKNADILLEKYNGILPRNIEELTALPGVGRKTANVLLHELWNISEGIVVDTHVIRITNLLKIVNTKNPVLIEKELMKIVPKKYWHSITHYLIIHGREKCIQRKLECEVCDLIRKNEI